MTTDWPLRPFLELPPPESGSAVVRREARRRRRRAATTSALVAVLVLAGGVALAWPDGPAGRDTLRVTDSPPQVAPTSSAPTASPGETSASATPSDQPSASAVRRPVADPRATVTADAPRARAYRTPDLARTYTAASTGTDTRLCTGSASGSAGGVTATIDWCLDAVVRGTGVGHDLVAEVCRDATSDSRLTFETGREVELTVQDGSGRTVWTWSVGHEATPDPHTLPVARGHCWVWTAAWTDVDAHGRRLPPGPYQLTVEPLAKEVEGAPAATASFRV